MTHSSPQRKRRLLTPVKVKFTRPAADILRHETPRKPGEVGEAAPTGRGPERPRVRPRRDRPPPEDHAADRLQVAADASARRGRRPGRPADAGPSVETDGAAEADLGGLPCEKGVCLRVCHGFLDRPSRRRVDSPTLGCRVPRRRRSSADGRPGFSSLKGRSGPPLNASRGPCSGKSKVHWFAPRAASAPEAAMKITFTGLGRAPGSPPPLPGGAAEAAPSRRVAVPARAGRFQPSPPPMPVKVKFIGSLPYALPSVSLRTFCGNVNGCHGAQRSRR